MRRGDLVALGLAVLSGGYVLLDGLVATLSGDYITPGGDGQLGPWSVLVQAVGIAPRSALMHGVFLALGLVTLVAASAFARRAPRAREALLGVAVLGLWYLPFGTLFGLVEIALLWRGRAAAGAPAQ